MNKMFDMILISSIIKSIPPFYTNRTLLFYISVYTSNNIMIGNFRIDINMKYNELDNIVECSESFTRIYKLKDLYKKINNNVNDIIKLYEEIGTNYIHTFIYPS